MASETSLARRPTCLLDLANCLNGAQLHIHGSTILANCLQNAPVFKPVSDILTVQSSDMADASLWPMDDDAGNLVSNGSADLTLVSNSADQRDHRKCPIEKQFRCVFVL